MIGKHSASDPDFTSDQKIKLLSSGRAYFELLIRLIEHARENIQLQVYIYEPDETGQQVADALIRAAKRKVKVYILVDGYGSQGLKRSFFRQFRENGIHFRFFKPLFKSRDFYVGRRMHQKMLVVDAQYAIVTGINIGNRYNDKPGQPAWLDFGVYIAGEVAVWLCKWGWTTWRNFKRIKNAPCGPPLTAVDFGYDHIGTVRVRRNDWVRRKYEISDTYKAILGKAQTRVIILSSYFLPGYAVREDIKGARRRGVQVEVIVCSRMDVPLVKDAERFMYSWLLRQGVKIYEYSGNILHGKLATCDDEWMTIGSFNVNDLSARASIELNVDIKSKPFVREVTDKMEYIMSRKAMRVNADNFTQHNGWWHRLIQWFAFKFLRLIFFLGTFYIKQEDPRGN
ncbi:phospholipase D-like domain-containing protein [Parapedobacter lycopersici]|uniref:phospholipase D-like domain-containing protein n=1 Tax=Parapedobacter lycopersici TaxID=1864939 RepID=UPI00333F7A40